jgi:hypothetical protein
MFGPSRMAVKLHGTGACAGSETGARGSTGRFRGNVQWVFRPEVTGSRKGRALPGRVGTAIAVAAPGPLPERIQDVEVPCSSCTEQDRTVPVSLFRRFVRSRLT